LFKYRLAHSHVNTDLCSYINVVSVERQVLFSLVVTCVRKTARRRKHHCGKSVCTKTIGNMTNRCDRRVPPPPSSARSLPLWSHLLSAGHLRVPPDHFDTWRSSSEFPPPPQTLKNLETLTRLGLTATTLINPPSRTTSSLCHRCRPSPLLRISSSAQARRKAHSCPGRMLTPSALNGLLSSGPQLCYMEAMRLGGLWTEANTTYGNRASKGPYRNPTSSRYKRAAPTCCLSPRHSAATASEPQPPPRSASGSDNGGR
jgi:hypothetical protein